MKKRNILLISFLVPAVMLSASFYGCTVLEKGFPPDSEKPNGGSNQANNFLNQTETEGLIYITEEEKFIRDLNGFFYDKWNLEIFLNTRKAAHANMNSVMSLIAKYGLENPVKNDKVGNFMNPHLQDLYSKIAQDGSNSVEDALRASAFIEELDIADLEMYLHFTTNPDVEKVYINLAGSAKNHLRSFIVELNKRNISYVPQVLPKDEFDMIINENDIVNKLIEKNNKN
jgi:hypothetical protein